MKLNLVLPILGLAVIIAGAILFFSGYFDSRVATAPPVASNGESSSPQPAVDNTSTVNVIVPELNQVARLGEVDFNENCAACHGINAAGTGSGPSLISNIYRPGHHANIAFKIAANQGVRAHHWRFGNMPPLPHVDDQMIARIVVYIRALQAANGIR